MIQTDSQLAELLPPLARVDRIAVDTEADSLHCYFEKLCLVQVSVPGGDWLIDPLANFPLDPLFAAWLSSGKPDIGSGHPGPHRLSVRDLPAAAQSLVERLHDKKGQPFKDATGKSH